MRWILAAGACAALLAAAPARAAWAPDGADLARPRILRLPADLAAVQDRLDREPYASIVRDLARRAQLADGVALDDHTIVAGRF